MFRSLLVNKKEKYFKLNSDFFKEVDELLKIQNDIILKLDEMIKKIDVNTNFNLLKK